MAMDGKRLTSREACLIINACKDAGVEELVWESLRIRFRGPVQSIPVPIHVPEVTLERQKAIEKESLETQEFDLRQEQLERLRVEDPLEYERLHAIGDLDEPSKVGDAGDDDGTENQARYYRTEP